jgi:hypothetical protein
VEIYPMLLIAGLIGLTILAALGFIHAPGHHHHSGGHHTGDLHLEAHGHAHHTPSLHAHGAQAHHGPAPGGHVHGGHVHGSPTNGAAVPQAGNAHAAHGQTDSADPSDAGSLPRVPPVLSPLLWLLPLLSPVNWFSWMVGAGAAGAIARMLGSREPVTAVIAFVGAVVFHMGVIQPIWKLVFGFASQPARGLEGCLLQVVEAETSFNERGEGLVRVTIDGRSEDVLARLTDGERAGGLRIRRGDLLMIEEVDTQRNSCRVSRA